MQPAVLFDAAPIGKTFGNVLVDVDTIIPYKAGQIVYAKFVAANPRNNLRLEGTFLSVEQLVSGQWTAVRSDSHPSTIYNWKSVSKIRGISTVIISWTIEAGTPGANIISN
jgi:neutral ceramidase